VFQGNRRQSFDGDPAVSYKLWRNLRFEAAAGSGEHIVTSIVRDLPLRMKLLAIATVSAGLVIAANLLVTTLFDHAAIRRDVLDQLRITLQLTAEHCEAPLAFEDDEALQATLASLWNVPSIVSASVCDLQGRQRASYQRAVDAVVPGGGGGGGGGSAGAEPFDPMADATGAGHGELLELQHEIAVEGSVVGTLFVRASNEANASRLGKHVGLVVGLFVLALLPAYLLVVRMQLAVARPVRRLAEVAKQIANDRDYSIRVEKSGSDEIGMLCDGFNSMLEEIQAAEVEVRQSVDRFRTLVENAPEAIVLLDVERRRFVDVNRNAEELFGLDREALLARSPVDVSPARQTDGRLSQDAVVDYVGQAVEGGTPVFEWLHLDANGKEIPCEIRLVRMPSAKGCFVRGSITDITERRDAMRRQKRMMQELDHRVKNTLAMVVSLAEQTARGTDSIDGFVERFVGRLRSLARTHEALAASHWAAIDLLDVVELTLAPYRDEAGERITISGESLQLYPEAAAPICMTLHELVTNAVKYGALASGSGTIEISWQCNDDTEVEMTWVERGVPGVPASFEPGLGMRLIHGLIEHELLGTVKMECGENGLTCSMVFPLERGESAHG